MFFVISGYLISKIIYEEVGAGRFSVARFYERRVRRILPALFFVSLLTAAAVRIFLWPTEMVEFADSLAWSLLFLPNLYFHLHSGYFAPGAETLPLLHYWSQAEIPKGGDFMGFGFDSLWMMSGSDLIRVNTTDNSFIEIEVAGASGDSYRGIGEGAVWIPDVLTETIFKVDPNSNKVVS